MNLNSTISHNEIFGGLTFIGDKLANAFSRPKTKAAQKTSEIQFTISYDFVFKFLEAHVKILKEIEGEFISLDKKTAKDVIDDLGPVEELYSEFMNELDGVDHDNLQEFYRSSMVIEMLQILQRIKSDCQVVIESELVDENSADYKDWLSREMLTELQKPDSNSKSIYSNADEMFADI